MQPSLALGVAQRIAAALSKNPINWTVFAHFILRSKGSPVKLISSQAVGLQCH